MNVDCGFGLCRSYQGVTTLAENKTAPSGYDCLRLPEQSV
jgi:hypothetical protein